MSNDTRLNNLSFIEEENDFGGIKYIRKHLEIYIPYTAFATFGVIIGIAGNYYFK